MNVLGTGNPVADTDVYVDDGVQLSSSPPVRSVKFGEDYSLEIPLGSRRRNFSATMSNRSQATADLIDAYFDYLAGEPVNNFHVLNDTVTVVVLQWSKVFRASDTYTISASFKEVKR
jgi:phage-related protein